MACLTDACREYGHETLAGAWRNVTVDILRYLTKSPENIALGVGRKRKISAFLTPELQCLFIHRISHWLFVKGWRNLAGLTGSVNFLIYKVSITPQSCIGPGCRLSHPPGVLFHGRAGCNLTLFSMAVCCADEMSLDGEVGLGPRLGNDVQVGAHAVIMGPRRIGDRVKITYIVRLTKDAPADTLVFSRAMRPIIQRGGR